ncbi:hypothetical protein [Chelativorans sp. AA-79]|uniref:hypothetical protein n=1 Tax=Chelativorans sp. AA-79 TaxID=3028735 RepID=UPI0023F9CC34|nr:hypothetical protein [Chelativorans sp. AA-79]WEX11055.1 hypothetical protein PVE73_09045 [Chelativorans sp. AA-79]
MTRLALLERLKQLQQMPKFHTRDITTVSAMLSNEALAKHVELCEEAVGAPGRPASRDERSPGHEKGVPSGRA